MAKLIPAHIKRIPTTSELTGQFVWQDGIKKVSKMLNEAENNMGEFNFFGYPVSIIDMSFTKINKYTAQLVMGVIFLNIKNTNITEVILNKVKKKAPSSYLYITENINFISYPVHSYVEHEVDILYYVKKTRTYIHLTDELPDICGNTYKIYAYTIEPHYYCNDCDEIHTHEVEELTSIFSSKEEAITFIKHCWGVKKLEVIRDRRNENGR